MSLGADNAGRESPGRESTSSESSGRPRTGRFRRAGAKPSPRSSLLANLATTPFINRRPVQRFIVAAWAIGALLAGVNLLLWVQYRHESTALRARLATTRQAIEAKSKRIVEVNDELSGLRLPAQNSQVAFLNQRIAERTFPWSLLFERIAATLPDGVRLVSLSPVFADKPKGGAAPAKKGEVAVTKKPEDEVINLKIRGAAQSDESLYELIDRFFASPAFASPRLYQESSSSGEVEFTVDVDYKPRYYDHETHEPATPEGDVATDGDAATDGDVATDDTVATDNDVPTAAAPAPAAQQRVRSERGASSSPAAPATPAASAAPGREPVDDPSANRLERQLGGSLLEESKRP